MNYSQDANSRMKNSKRKKRRKKKATVGLIFLRLFIVLAIVGCFAAGGAFIGAYTGIIESAPKLSAVNVVPESYTSIIYDENGNEIDTLHGEENREYVKISQIPLKMQQAVVAIEDERFYDHNGIDIKGMFRALFVNLKSREFSQGASTITQQLMKNEVLTAEKKLSRKLQEQYLAVRYEKQLIGVLGSKRKAKDYILELYLNTISLNHGLNGVEAAAKFYFGKDVSELTLAQCASIAGITKNPSAYSPLSHPEKNKERRETVLNKMLELGYITQSEYNEAKSEDITGALVGLAETNDGNGSYHNYFVDSVITQLAEQLMRENNISKQQAYNAIYSGGLKIYTTLNTSMQDTLENSFADDSLFPPKCNTITASYTLSVSDNITGEQENIFRESIVANEDEANSFAQTVKDEVLSNNKTMILDKLTVAKSLQAAMVIMDYHTGHVKAIIGGREKSGDLVFNRATQALRQPGSCFKVLAAYAPAIDLGLVMPGTGIRDEYFEYNGWVPKNWYSGGYRGMSTVREGIQDSMNILAAKVIVDVGVETSLDYLENFGVTSLVREPDENGNSDREAIALGGLTKGISVLELTAAYSAIANGGTYITPVFYTKVVDHDGNVIIDNTNPESHRVIKETTAYMLTDMMKDVITKGTGGLARFRNISMSQAGKTGTTTDDKDLSFAGYTPYYCAAIWMGYDNPKRMEYDKSYHLLLWRDVMEKIHEGLSDPGFTRPDGLTTKSICSASGKTPNSYCANDYYGNSIASDLCAAEYVDNNGTCDIHNTFTVCSKTGKLPNENCEKMSVVLATEEENGAFVIKNIPSEMPEGKISINLNETCTEEHAPDISEEGGIFGQENNNEGDNNNFTEPNDPNIPISPITPDNNINEPTEPNAPNENNNNNTQEPQEPVVTPPPENNVSAPSGDDISTLPGISDE